MKEAGCVQMCVSLSLSHVFRYLCVRVLLYGNAVIKSKLPCGHHRHPEMGSLKLFCILGGYKVDRSKRTNSEYSEKKREKNTAAFLHIFPCIFLPSHASPLFSIPSCTRSSGYPSSICLPLKTKTHSTVLGFGKTTRVD